MHHRYTVHSLTHHAPPLHRALTHSPCADCSALTAYFLTSLRAYCRAITGVHQGGGLDAALFIRKRGKAILPQAAHAAAPTPASASAPTLASALPTAGATAAATAASAEAMQQAQQARRALGLAETQMAEIEAKHAQMADALLRAERLGCAALRHAALHAPLRHGTLCTAHCATHCATHCAMHCALHRAAQRAPHTVQRTVHHTHRRESTVPYDAGLAACGGQAGHLPWLLLLFSLAAHGYQMRKRRGVPKVTN